jgi:hypothetical protein
MNRRINPEELLGWSGFMLSSIFLLANNLKPNSLT